MSLIGLPLLIDHIYLSGVWLGDESKNIKPKDTCFREERLFDC